MINSNINGIKIHRSSFLVKKGLSALIQNYAKNKWASFTCWNGDPFNITAYPTAIYGEEKLLYFE